MLDELIKLSNELYQKYESMPIKIKMNEEWLNGQIKNQNIIFNDNKNAKSNGFIGTFTGIPVEIDNTISSYKLVYSETTK
jgi:hypothetical protein